MSYLLHQLLFESAQKFPDREAVVFKEKKISYAELDEESNRLSQCLRQLGIVKGERVGIYMNRGIDSVVSLFGVLKASATYVPIDPLCPSERLKYIINKCEIRFLVTVKNKLNNSKALFSTSSPLACILVMDSQVNEAETLGSGKVLGWLSMRDQLAADAPIVSSIDKDIAYILFTSGSTGNPKGVMLSHKNAMTFIKSAKEFFEVTSEDRLSNICPLHFDMSVFDLYVGFLAGATVVILPEMDAVFPIKISEYIQNKKITIWNSVPSALSMLAAFKSLDNYDLSSLRLVLFAGEQFPLKYLKRLQRLLHNTRFCNMYGQTEANSSLYYWVEQQSEDENRKLPIGKTLPNFEAFALDTQGNQIREPGQEGELYVRGSTVAYGYLEEPEKTHKAFVVNPLQPELQERVYKTGDLVNLDSRGNFVFLGRKDHMIKSRGYRIEIGEIEAVLCNYEKIANAVVIPVPDELIGNRISALIVPTPKSKIDKQEVVLYCSQHLPKYMIPETLEFRDLLPTTSSGKVDRKRLNEEVTAKITGE